MASEAATMDEAAVPRSPRRDMMRHPAVFAAGSADAAMAMEAVASAIEAVRGWRAADGSSADAVAQQIIIEAIAVVVIPRVFFNMRRSSVFSSPLAEVGVSPNIVGCPS